MKNSYLKPTDPSPKRKKNAIKTRNFFQKEFSFPFSILKGESRMNKNKREENHVRR